MNNPWEKIEIPKEEFNARRVDSAHKLNLFWAKDVSGNFLFVVDIESDSFLKNQIPEIAGIKITPYQYGKIIKLVFVLNKVSDWELFYSVCDDIIKTTEGITAKHAWDVIRRRLIRWREFLKRSRSQILSEEKIKGLIGELIFLKNFSFVKFGISASLKNWTGPLGTPQDFVFPDCAVEVKCQAGTAFSHITISSADQLVSPSPSLYIFVVTLTNAESETPNMVSLPLIIRQIEEIIDKNDPNVLETFKDLLLNVGYQETESYENYYYLLLDTRMYKVGDGFPRILPEQVPAGIDKISYRIDLSPCKEFLVDISSWRQ